MKNQYTKPVAEYFYLAKPLNVLFTVSLADVTADEIDWENETWVDSENPSTP